MGPKGSNFVRMRQIEDLVRIWRLPWQLLDDFNIPPHALEETGWLNRMGAVARTAEGMTVSCNLGSGTLIDYVVHSASLGPLIECILLSYSPSKGHNSLQVGLRSSGMVQQVRTQWQPRSF